MGGEGCGGGRAGAHAADVDEERVGDAVVVGAADVEQEAGAVCDAEREREAHGDLVKAELCALAMREGA